ncbi:GNAT family N-acetyltransferase [Kutzneria kofuensis]|uniref:Ribosomal protein S18 acetylase RimI-like enzyme n=1 Tax=Kutzneria kofuensis TaxID=103725 RepID=A0A7W9KAC5_9PSEU|nr:GNAT family N-acetyltransferase [Kutzneria kofuensis]MBB5888821.1 ribosomal protein S18 acetylase RimI-like enzyme [Kutzneria kofuensis]
MEIAVRKATLDDLPAIAALLRAARGDGLSERERAERGFVQGNLSDQVLTRFITGTGAFVAVHGDELAGVALTSDPAPLAAGEGPPAGTIQTARAAGMADFALYGPVAVDPRFQGRGVLRLLVDAVKKSLSTAYDEAALFVELTNEKSLAVHRHLGMREIGEFTAGGRRYLAFAFALND